jgi:hypothetical protein
LKKNVPVQGDEHRRGALLLTPVAIDVAQLDSSGIRVISG